MKTKYLFFTVISVLFLSSYSLTAQQNTLLGNWESSNGSIISFTKSKLGINGVYYDYQLSDNVIHTADEYGNVYDYTYQIKSGKLYLQIPDMGTYILSKVSDNQANSKNASIGSKNTGGGAGASRVSGNFCSYSSSGYSGSSSYSTTKTVSFDGRGNFVYGSQSSYSGGGDLYSGGGGGERGTYSVQGKKVILTFSDGSKYAVEIYSYNNSGEINGLKYDGTVYAKALCD